MAIQYYKLSDSTDLKEIGGDFPQVQRTYNEYDLDAPNSYINVPVTSFPDFEPNLYYFTINPKGILTDMISTSMLNGGSLVSERFKSLLEDGFNLTTHRFFPATVKYKGKFFDNYFWMHVVSDYSQYIDFTNTHCLIKRFYTNLGNISIGSYAEFIDRGKLLFEDYSYIRSNDIYLKGDFYNFKLDLFIVGRIDEGLCISEKLKNRIELEKISGVKISKSLIAPL